MANNKNWSKESLKFITPSEKLIHKIVSGICYGESIKIDKPKDLEEKDFAIIVRKSARYNNIELHQKWSIDKKSITIKVSII